MLNSKTCFTGNADNYFHYFLQNGPIQVKLWGAMYQMPPLSKMPRLSCFLAKNSKRKKNPAFGAIKWSKSCTKSQKKKKWASGAKNLPFPFIITFFVYSPKIEVYIRE